LSSEVKDKVDGPVADLSSHMSRPIKKNLVAALVVEEVLALLKNYSISGFQSVRDEWSKYDALRGAEVYIEGLDGQLHGIACGVSEKGALILDTEEGQRLIHGGEVSLRRRAE
jgi:BirA family biotin operon repressor/biotin-[acetyl-CoA-carboxylase] ligase